MHNQTTIVRPRLTVLEKTQVEQVHEYSLQILSSVGVRVDSAGARKLFAAAGAEEAGDHRLRIPRDLVEWALTTAPSTVDIYDRRAIWPFACRAEPALASASPALYYQDPETDQVAALCPEAHGGHGPAGRRAAQL